MVAVFHLGGGWARERFHGLSTALHAVGTLSTGAAIALVGQIFNIQEHWPAAVLMWALAALAGWILLRDEAQQTLTLLLFRPGCSRSSPSTPKATSAKTSIMGRFLIVWAVLYLTFFLGSKRKIVQGILFAAAAISAVVGTVLMLDGWQFVVADQTYLSFGTAHLGLDRHCRDAAVFAVFQVTRA